MVGRGPREQLRELVRTLHARGAHARARGIAARGRMFEADLAALVVEAERHLRELDS
jgi:hypothetical protein